MTDERQVDKRRRLVLPAEPGTWYEITVMPDQTIILVPIRHVPVTDLESEGE